MITTISLTLTHALAVIFITPIVVAIFPLLYLIVVLFGLKLPMLAIVNCRCQMLTPALATLS